MKEDIVIYANKSSLLAGAAASLVFTGLSVYFLIYGHETSRFPGALDRLIKSVSPAIWYIGVVFFGICFIYICYRLVNPKPALVINQIGLSYWGTDFMRWEEIKRVFIYEEWGNRFLGITPVDTNAFIARQSPMKRLVHKMFGGMSIAPMAIAERILPMSLDELLLKIQALRDDVSKDRA